MSHLPRASADQNAMWLTLGCENPGAPPITRTALSRSDYGLTKTTVLVAVTVLMLAGCGTIMHGKKQAISIESQPTGARVTVDGTAIGTTPLIWPLERKNEHYIRIDLDGYESFEIALNQRISGWVWGNLLPGAVIGIGLDAVTGGLYNLSPNQRRAHLGRRQAREEQEPKGLEFFVVGHDDGDRRVIAPMVPK